MAVISPKQNKINKVIELIKESNKIIVFTGAGVSTNSGIPDFRSKDGLYSYAKEKYNLPYPEAIFDIEYFVTNPKPFFLFSKELLSQDIKPSLTHKMIALLEEKKKLEIVATQNIDMLHEKAGNRKTLSCHGTYQKATCRNCGKEYKYNQIEDYLLKAEVPKCQCGGIIKPNITFFGEALPADFYTFMEKPPQAYLVLVIGTSLEVVPANQIPLFYCGRIPTVIINRDKTSYDNFFDHVIYDDCDTFSKQVLDIIGKVV